MKLRTIFVICMCTSSYLLFMWYTNKDNAFVEVAGNIRAKIWPPAPNGGTVDDFTSREAVFDSRRRHLSEACASEGRPVSQELRLTDTPGRLLVGLNHNILYCPIQKVASCFWKRLMASVNSQGHITNPYSLPIMAMPGIKKFEVVNSTMKEEDVLLLLKKSTTIIVVRDPYTKLFSGYADKLFHPNYAFWTVPGKRIRNMFGNHQDADRNQNNNNICGNDVTFSEFIKYIIYTFENDEPLNPHFTPLYKHCDPCKTRFDYVIKIESFKADVFYVVNKWKDEFGVNITFGDFEQNFPQLMAKSHINLSFATKKKSVNHCNMTDHYFLLRTWRWLQMSGILPKNKAMPFPAGPAARNVTEDEYMDVVMLILKEGTNSTALKLQRKEAFLQAYNTVSADDLEKLRKYMLPDFHYFQYDDRPKELFDRVEGQFQYFEGL